MNQQKGNQASNRKGTRVAQPFMSGNVPKPKAPKINPAHAGEFSFVNDPRVKDSFVVMVAAPEGIRSFTFHHPIGITKLDGKQWVVSETSDIPLLLSREKDPNKKLVDEARDGKILRSAVRAELLKTSGTRVFYPDGVERNPLTAAARKQAVAAKAAKKDAYLDFLDDIHREYEKKYLEHVRAPALLAMVAETYPYPGYETKGGITATKAQVPIPNSWNYGRGDLIDFLTERIMGFDLPERKAVSVKKGSTIVPSQVNVGQPQKSE